MKMENKKLLIIGAGGHGKVSYDVAKTMGRWDEIGFLDDNKVNGSINNINVIDTVGNFIKYIDSYDFFIGIGDNKIREKIYKRLKKSGAQIVSLIHPSTVIGSNTIIKEGTVIMPGTVINAESLIGVGSIINTNATIEHENMIGDFTHISPGAILAGNVDVGDRVWVGAGSIIKENISINNDILIGAGAVVVKNIIEKGVYIGVPARIERDYNV